MWSEYVKMTMQMPEGSMREVDTRLRFPAYLLTYSQTKLNIDDAYKKLLGYRFWITEVVVEKHVEGGEHIHAVLICPKGKRRRLSPAEVTIGGERPNVKGKGMRDVLAARMYIRKGYIDSRGLQDLNEKHSKWQRLLHQETFEDAMRMWPGISPDTYILQRNNGEIGLRAHYENKMEKFVSRYSLDDFNAPNKVLEWAQDNIGKSERQGKSLILWGDTRLGKTQLARSLGNHWYLCADWDVMQVRSDADYGVIDDIPVSVFRYWKQFLGCQEQFTVTDKYFKKKQLLWGKPVIWICNEDPRVWGLSINELEWLYGNCIVCHIVEKLY